MVSLLLRGVQHFTIAASDIKFLSETITNQLLPVCSQYSEISFPCTIRSHRLNPITGITTPRNFIITIYMPTSGYHVSSELT
mmetsp:Transcript_21787/g.37474  ORF Transcript_21787/g.37474 Transcript_21787/m.37474 type:complete len:82 (+) Transcript_21787:673-918(+)